MHACRQANKHEWHMHVRANNDRLCLCMCMIIDFLHRTVCVVDLCILCLVMAFIARKFTAL